MTGTGTARLRGPRWVEATRSPRYDVWVSRTQVASPWCYRPELMGLWDRALERPLIELHGQAAGAVLDDVAAAVARLRLWSANPETPRAGDAAQKLEFMRHLCAVGAGEWFVRVELVDVVSYFELAAAAMDGVIKPELAVSVARERGGSEADVRSMLQWAVECVKADRNGGPARTSRRKTR